MNLYFDHVLQVFTYCVSKPFAFWQRFFCLHSECLDRISWGILGHIQVDAIDPAGL